VQDVQARAKRAGKDERFLRSERGARAASDPSRHEPHAVRRPEEKGAEEVVDAAVHEDVVDAAAPLRAEDLHGVRPALGHEESAGLEDEARAAKA
jgi:hypothetical protein